MESLLIKLFYFKKTKKIYLYFLVILTYGLTPNNINFENRFYETKPLEIENNYTTLTKNYSPTIYDMQGSSWRYKQESKAIPPNPNNPIISECPNHLGCPLKISERNKAYELAPSPDGVIHLPSINGWERPLYDGMKLERTSAPIYYGKEYKMSDKYRSGGKLPERIDYTGHLMLEDRILKTNIDGHPYYKAGDNGIDAYYNNLKVNIPDRSKPMWRVSGSGYYREMPYKSGWHLHGMNKTYPTIEVPIAEHRGLIVNGKVLKDMFSVKNYFEDSSWSQSSWNEAGIGSAEDGNEMLVEDYSNDNNFYGRNDDICKGPNCIRGGGNGISRKYVARHKKKTKHHGNKFHH